MEERIGTVVDLGEVTWLIQADAPERLPAPLADKLATIPMQSVSLHERSIIMVSLLAEVLADLDISPADPAVRWEDILKRGQSSRPASGDEPRLRNSRPGWWTGSWHSPRDTYDQLRTAVIEAQYDAAAARLPRRG